MKQSELDRETRHICKLDAKRRGWKSVGGMPYWTIGPLFFLLLTTARIKERTFHCSLEFKWLAMDMLLWKILALSSNENQPFSLHANGAFVLRGIQILDASESAVSWEPGVLESKIAKAAERAEQRAREVSTQAATLDSYVAFIRREHELFMRRYPRAALNLYKEELLAALIAEDVPRAKSIARERIAAGDIGSFHSGGKTFYEGALAFCTTLEK
jgi:hypothetical protein